MTILDRLCDIVGEYNVFEEQEGGKYGADWTHSYVFKPLAVVRPADTKQVSDVVKLANAEKIAIVPMGGNTGLAGGTHAQGALVLSLERLNTIREVRTSSRIAVVEAGVVLDSLHRAVDENDLIFPITFGARGSAMLGGMLSTNAGGSNVLRYGNTRDLCLGLEVVLPSGEIMDLMSELHKDNSGYDLRHLMIGAEGTLGIITAAVLKLQPKPNAYATAMVATRSLEEALLLLNSVQMATGGAVQAFEYMPEKYLKKYFEVFPKARQPFAKIYEHNIMVELGTTVKELYEPSVEGKIQLIHRLESILEQEFETGRVLEAVVAQNLAQRNEMWERREAAAEITISQKPLINNDVALPLDKVSEFFETIGDRLEALDPGIEPVCVAHLGDGNVHYVVWPKSQNPAVHDEIVETVEEIVLSLGGSFSAEHGIGIAKLPSMERRKNPVAMAVMRQIKVALDPNNLMNPGKVIPK
jgi:FAD/FMN-containing dehydrogenase